MFAIIAADWDYGDPFGNERLHSLSLSLSPLLSLSFSLSQPLRLVITVILITALHNYQAHRLPSARNSRIPPACSSLFPPLERTEHGRGKVIGTNAINPRALGRRAGEGWRSSFFAATRLFGDSIRIRGFPRVLLLLLSLGHPLPWPLCLVGIIFNNNSESAARAPLYFIRILIGV